MKYALTLVFLLFVISCGNDKTSGVTVPIDLKLYDKMISPKIVGLSASCVGFIVVRIANGEFPIVYKVDRPRRRIMDNVVIEKWFEEPSLGFDGNDFNQLMIPENPNGDVILYYHHLDNDVKWKKVIVTDGVINFEISTTVVGEMADVHFTRLKTHYDKWVNSID